MSTQILPPAKTSFENEAQIKEFLNKRKLRALVTYRPPGKSPQRKFPQQQGSDESKVSRQTRTGGSVFLVVSF